MSDVADAENEEIDRDNEFEGDDLNEYFNNNNQGQIAPALTIEQAVDWQGAHDLTFVALLKEKANANNEEFHFDTCLEIYQSIVFQVPDEHKQHAIILVVSHILRLPASKTKTGPGHVVNLLMKVCLQHDAHLVPPNAVNAVDAAGGQLASFGDKFGKLSDKRKVEYFERLQRRLYPGCALWRPIHLQLVAELKKVWNEGANQSSSTAAATMDILHSSTSATLASGNTEVNRWALVAHAYLDSEVREWALAAETGVLPKDSSTSGTARRQAAIDALNLGGGFMGIKKYAQSQLLKLVLELKGTFSNPFATRNFNWKDGRSGTLHQREKPLAHVRPHQGWFDDGADISSCLVKIRSEVARVRTNTEKSGMHCTGSSHEDILCAFCHRGGGSVCDHKALYTVLLWQNQSISGTGAALPAMLGTQLGTPAPAIASTSAAATVLTSAPPQVTPSSTVNNAAEKRKRSTRAMEDVGNDLRSISSELRNCINDFARADSAADAASLANPATSVSSRSASGVTAAGGKLQLMVAELNEGSISTVADALKAAGISEEVWSNVRDVSGLKPEDTVEYLVQIVLECDKTKEVKDLVGLTLRDAAAVVALLRNLLCA